MTLTIATLFLIPTLYIAPDSTEDDSIHFYIIYIISGSIGVLIVVVILSVVLYLGVKKAHGKNRVTVLCERTHAFSH